MNILAIRQLVKEMYPNQNWSKQVDRMPDEQVFSIYMRNVETLPKLPQKEQPPAQLSLPI